MAKSELRQQAQDLRSQGVSVRTIATTLHVARSSVSNWVREIILTREQIELLMKRPLEGSAIGRLKSAEVRRERRLTFINQENVSGRNLITPLTDREVLLTGLALYWGEGSKKNGRVQFCNSDPNMIQFFILWLEKCFQINQEELTCWVGINEIHRIRDNIVKTYWSNVTSIPLSQFTNTSFKKVVNQKVYSNFEEHFGTLFVSVNKPMRIYYKILGMIDSLGEQARVAQR